MARPSTQNIPAPTKNTKPNGAGVIPKATDARAELFFLLGALQGAGVESANRITELTIDLTAPPTAEGDDGER